MNEIKKAESHVTDQEVISRVLKGETFLYEILMRRYNPRLYRIGKGFFRDEDELEDLMQSAYIKAFENLSSFENRSSFPTWLIRIFINEAIARKKYKSKFTENNSDDEDNNELYDKTDMNTPEKTAVNNELKIILEKAIDALPDKYRVVFIMHELENMTVKEISALLSLTGVNIKVRLNRARKMLRENISQFYNPEEIYSFNLVRCDAIVKKVFSVIAEKELS